MDRSEVRDLLRRVATGQTDVDSAVATLAAGPLADGQGFADLGFARLDTHRALRTGDPEVVYAAGKTSDQTVSCSARSAAAVSGRRWPPAPTRRRSTPSLPPSPTPTSTANPAAPPWGSCHRREAPSRWSQPARATARWPRRRRSSPGPSAQQSTAWTTSGSRGCTGSSGCGR